MTYDGENNRDGGKVVDKVQKKMKDADDLEARVRTRSEIIVTYPYRPLYDFLCDLRVLFHELCKIVKAAGCKVRAALKIVYLPRLNVTKMKASKRPIYEQTCKNVIIQ